MSVFGSLAPVVVGAFLGFLPAFINETVKDRRARKARWDISLYTVTSEFVAGARNLLHLTERRVYTKDREHYMQLVDEEHQRLRGLMQRIRRIGTAEVQESAGLVLHHAYSVRILAETGKDPYVDDYQLRPSVRLARSQH